jgi:hypothetical protein
VSGDASATLRFPESVEDLSEGLAFDYIPAQVELPPTAFRIRKRGSKISYTHPPSSKLPLLLTYLSNINGSFPRYSYTLSSSHPHRLLAPSQINPLIPPFLSLWSFNPSSPRSPPPSLPTSSLSSLSSSSHHPSTLPLNPPSHISPPLPSQTQKSPPPPSWLETWN